jgi:hypothetical protein
VKSYRWFAVVALLSSLSSAGCSSLSGSAIRTGPLVLPPYVGAVSLYASGQVPTEAAGHEVRELGAVEVRGAEGDSEVGTLLPLLVQKAAEIGGNAVVLDSVDARFDTYITPHIETYMIPCGYRRSCYQTRRFLTSSEVLIVSLRGRAFKQGGGQ